MYKVVLEVEPLLLFLDQIISYIRTGIKGLIQLMFLLCVGERRHMLPLFSCCNVEILLS